MVAEVYDDWAELYAYIHGTPEEGVEYYERTIGKQLSSILPDGGMVLDVGCGIGLSTAGLLNNGFDVTGIDISQNSLDVAAERLRPYEGRFELFHCNALRLEQFYGTFDAVVAVSGLSEHFDTEEEQKNLFKELARVLKQGGVILLDSYDHENMASSDAEDRITLATIVNLPNGPALYTERRQYSGMPRNRIYKRLYMYVDDEDNVVRLNMFGRALFLDEITRWLREDGFDECRWLNPVETGFYKHILTARFSRSKTCAIEKAQQIQEEHGGNSMVAKIKPADLPPNLFEEQPDYRRQTLVETRNAKGERVFERRNQATLVMFSGGIDSTYSLVMLLRESSDDIIAHHIHFVNMEGRHKAEAMACQRIVEYLKKTERGFMYTESTIDRRRFKSFGMDEVAVGFEVGIVSRSFAADRGYGIDRWTSGICLEEEIDDFGSDDIEQMQHALNSAEAAAFPHTAPRFFQLPIIGKRDQMDYMGEKLVGMCWTCRRPIWDEAGVPAECGECRTCLVMNDIRSGRPTIADG